MKNFLYYNEYHKRKIFWLLQLLFWLSNWILQILIYRDHLHCIFCFLRHTLSYVFAFILSMILRYFIKRYKLYNRSPFFIISFVIISSLTCGLIWIVFVNLLRSAFNGVFIFHYDDFIKFLWYNILSSVYPFLVWNSIYLGFKIYEEVNIHKESARQALELAQRAQLEMLRYQLNPHFLFNTLSSLRALIRNKDNDIAEEMVTKISEFLKYSLLEEEKNMVPLAREIKIIKHYFDIEKVRFGEQLDTEFNIAPETDKFPVPVFLIHPLIENAIKHGMKTSPAPLRISIKTSLTDDDLTIDIINTGKWVDKKFQEDSTGTGLQNTIKRLELIYPKNHIFKINKNDDSVHIHIQINKDNN